MGQPLRIETDEVCFITTRTALSKLWFINNHKLIEGILAYLAKYTSTYGVILYGVIIMGNHIHLLASFPRRNRASFMRNFNSIVSKLTALFVPEFPGGKLWGRRYSSEVVPRAEDVENQAFYLWLNPVSSGLVERISEYFGYNSFSHSISGIIRKFKLVNWTAYNNHKRFNPRVSREDFTETYSLIFARLPGYEHLSQNEYKKVMLKKLEEKRAEIIEQRRKDKLGFAGPKVLQTTNAGAAPKKTKKSSRYSKRPLVLTLCKETRQLWLSWYFSTYTAYKEASQKFRKRVFQVTFPTGTYPPPILNVA